MAYSNISGGRLVYDTGHQGVANAVWDPVNLDWTAMTQPGGGSGGGGAVTQSGTWVVGLSAGSNTIGAISNTSFAATQSGTWNVGITGTVPVSGTFWQSTQPVSIASMPTTPVTGTFWQTTQPVSLASLPALATGSNTIGNVNVNGTVPVSGTFWQATQPVSIASMPSTPVTGTFWQATQPVSLAAAVSTNADASIGAGTAPSKALVVGAVYNSSAPTLTTGQTAGLQLDASGNLKVNVVTGGGGGSNAAAGLTGSAVPTSASYTGFNSSGNLVGVSSSNPMPVNFTNTTIGVTGTFWQATQPVSGTFWQTTQPVSIASMPSTPVTGTFWQATQPVSLASMPTTPVKPDGTVWTLTSTSANVNVTNSSLAVTGTFWQSTQPVSLVSLPALATGSNVIGAVTQSGTWNIGSITTLPALPTGSNTIGAVNIAASQTIAVTQATAANLNATVTGTVTVGSITTMPALVAGSATIGKVDILGNAGATLDATIGAATAPTNALGVLGVYQTTIPALTAGQSVAQQVDTTGALWVNKDSRRATYWASSGAITPIAASSFPLWTIVGSSTKTVRLTHIQITCYCTTGTSLPATVTLQKLSSLTGGTAVTDTAVPIDSNSAAATAAVKTYAGGLPTASTVVGTVRVGFLQWVTGGATVAQPTSTLDWYFGNDGGSQAVLRGTSQWFGLLLSSIGTTPIMAINVEWVEDNS